MWRLHLHDGASTFLPEQVYYRRLFGPFLDENGVLLFYELDECYWLAGRRIILQVCRKFSKSVEIWNQSLEDEQEIIRQFRWYFDNSPVQHQVAKLRTYRMALSRALLRV